MGRIRGLELLFNLEKKKFRSKEDCVVAAFHCLLVNENFECVGIGDEETESDSNTELLPSGWNSNQNVYSLRYRSKDSKTLILLKITKMEHTLQVDVVRNEDAVASMSVPVENYVSDDFGEYSQAYTNLESLSVSFHEDILQKLQPTEKKGASSSKQKKKYPPASPNPSAPLRRPDDFRQERNPHMFPRLPSYGNRDLDPLGGGRGGMIMDPSDFGIPARPTLPQFGIGGRGGLPRGAVPPGARFDPFMPPMNAPHGFRPDPDHLRRPPDYDEDDYM